MSDLQNKAALATLADLGACGGMAITGMDEVVPDVGNYFFAIHTMEDTVVASQEDVEGAINPDLSAITSIPANTKIYGKYRSITLTSGSAIGYYAKG